jgi:hypothetical protein
MMEAATRQKIFDEEVATESFNRSGYRIALETEGNDERNYSARRENRVSWDFAFNFVGTDEGKPNRRSADQQQTIFRPSNADRKPIYARNRFHICETISGDTRIRKTWISPSGANQTRVCDSEVVEDFLGGRKS